MKFETLLTYVCMAKLRKIQAWNRICQTQNYMNTTSNIISPHCASKTEFDDSSDFNEVCTVGKKSQFPRKCCWNLVKGLPRRCWQQPPKLPCACWPTGRPAQRSVFRAGQAARAAGRLTGVSASADFCALPRIHEAWKGCEDDFRLCTLLAKNELEAVTVLPTIFFLSRYRDRSEQKPK